MTISTETTRRDLGALALGGIAAAAAAPAMAAPAMGMPSVGALTAGDWMAQVKAQHMAIDRQFAALKATRDGDTAGRTAGLKMLATLLTGHSIAEEVALYPGVAMKGDTAGSDQLYIEQQHAKVMVAELDNMPKTGPEFLARLTTLETALKAHVAEEEGQRYPALMRAATPAENAKMTADLRREFTRYIA